MTDQSTTSVRAGNAPETAARGGPQGNARLTAALGAFIFVALAAEGLTLLGVRQYISEHVFIGMLIVPAVLLKSGSTFYRFVHYYRGEPSYVRKGPPPIVLRVLGPFVVLTTVALLGTGIAALAVGPSTRWIIQAHKASFILWFGAMTIHVLGHIFETPALAFADWRREERSRVPAAATRVTTVILTIAIGVALATMSLGWIGAWHHVFGR